VRLARPGARSEPRVERGRVGERPRIDGDDRVQRGAGVVEGDDAVEAEWTAGRGLTRVTSTAGTVPGMLQHVTLEIARDRVDACVRFWGLLGFEPMVAPPLLRDRFVWVAREGTQIHLMPIDDPIVPDQGHTAVLPPDYDAALATLRDAGFEPRAGSNAWNAPRTFVRCPAGHLVELMSAPPYPPWPGEE
jgi:catechol 2,3-dioxygenase-like lactoylglutathione lyase family enzyme